MNKRSCMFIAAVLFLLPQVDWSSAAEDAEISGSVVLGGRLTDGEDDSAKFQEYRDLDDAILGDFTFNYNQDAYWLGAEGQNIGQDDQFYQLTGGSYEKFKYAFFYNEIPHNLTFDALSFYSGIGSDSLTITFADPDIPATWTNFDYQIETKTYGGDISFTLAEPFYFSLGANRQEKNGLKPLGSGSFSGAVEMPEPVDYTTDNYTANGGYRSDQLSIKISGLYSTFNNDKNFLDWQNPFLGITETNSLPADNNYAKIGADLMWRQLPLKSTFVVNGSYANLSNDFSVDAIGAPLLAGLNQKNFEGDITTTRLGASFVSHPLEKLDTRLFYDYYDQDNDSTVIDYTGGGNGDYLFGYTKNDLGVDAGYRLPAHTRLNGGYTYTYIDRTNRPDGENNADNLFYLKLKNTSLDFLTAKLEYSYLNRDVDSNYDLTGLTIFDPAYINPYVQRFDVAAKQRNAVKLAVEVSPLNSLDFGASYTYVDNNYEDVTLGRTNDNGNEFSIDFMWRAAKIFKLSGFAAYENYQADSNHYNYGPGQPSIPTIDDLNPASYRWTQSIDTNFWAVGLLGRMPLMKERLELTLSWQYQQADGKSDFTSQGLNPLLPINDYDDYDLNLVEAKAAYALTAAVDLTIGYLYEDLNYEDNQYQGYEYTPNGTYLSGAYDYPDYSNHLGYFTVRYKF